MTVGTHLKSQKYQKDVNKKIIKQFCFKDHFQKNKKKQKHNP